MKETNSSRRITALVLGAAASLSLFVAGSCVNSVRAADKAPASVEALLYSTMPSTDAHRPEMAMDGDVGTYFKSAYGMDDGDDFLVLLSQPIPVKSIRITTGDTDGQDLLTNGYIETSSDGTTYSTVASFDKSGVANASLGNKPVMALRIRVNRRSGIPSLLVREITIDSPTKISHIQLGPGRGFIDISEAPDVADWAQRAEKQMEESWADTAAILYTDKFITPNMVNVVYRGGPDVTPVAATGGGVMTVNIAWVRKQPNDTGLTVHETAHVIQAYSAYNPVWMVEGIADYIRWIRFEPQNYHVRIDPDKATYHDSYRTTATFLAWCELHYDSQLVPKMSHAVRFGNYTNDLFKTYCGKDVDTLWSEFIAAYKADPANIITKPIAKADRPRTMPTVKEGSSVAVDLSSAFNTTGFYKDGATFSESGGFDGGGAAYSADALGATPGWRNVRFTVGPPNAANVVTCKGGTVNLPSGNYTSLWLLGAGTDGNQMAQSFTVTYTDGTQENLIQNFSDWYLPQGFAGERRAVRMDHRNMADGTEDPRAFYVYSYGFPINGTKTVKSITLPNNEDVKLLAITLAN